MLSFGQAYQVVKHHRRRNVPALFSMVTHKAQHNFWHFKCLISDQDLISLVCPVLTYPALAHTQPPPPPPPYASQQEHCLLRKLSFPAPPDSCSFTSSPSHPGLKPYHHKNCVTLCFPVLWCSRRGRSYKILFLLDINVYYFRKQ